MTYTLLEPWSQFVILTTVPPLVSIVVPVYNGMPHLTALTQALLAQTYANLEIIFTEGGGSDQSTIFLNSITDSRIRVIQMRPGTSAGENWTAATQAAHGEFIKLVCQDDLIYPDAITKQVEDLLRHPATVMAVAQRDIIDGHGKTVYRKRGLSGVRVASGKTVPGSVLVRACYTQGTNVFGEPLTVLFRREPLLASLPWTDEVPLMLDLSMYEKTASLGDVIIRRESIGAFRVSASSWSTRLAKIQLKQTQDWQERFEKSAQPAIRRSERIQSVVARHKQTALRRLAYTAIRARGNWASNLESTS